MTKNDIEPTEVLAEPPLPTPPAAQPADTEQQADQVVPQEAAPVVPQQADQAMPHNPYAQSHVGTSPSQEKEKQVITFDPSDGRLPPPKFIPTAQEMYSELWEAGQRLVNEGLAQKGDAHGAAIAAAGADLMARAAEGMQKCEIPSAAKNFFDGILASLINAIVEKGDLLLVLERKPGSGGAPS